MSEQRSFWTATGVAVFSIGLTGFIGYLVGRGLQSEPFKWGVIAWITLAVTLAGVGILAWVLAQFARLRRIETELDDLTAQGNFLLEGILTKSFKEGEAATKFATWKSDTEGWFIENLPRFRSHFDNQAGQKLREELVPHISPALGSPDFLAQAYLLVHLQRLVEIRLKL